MDVTNVLALAKSIERRQRRGSDYDELYFGLQDIIYELEKLVDSGIDRSFHRGLDDYVRSRKPSRKPKRKLSKWQKFVKANSKKKQFIYQSGAKKGKLNLKKMGIAYRRKNK